MNLVLKGQTETKYQLFGRYLITELSYNGTILEISGKPEDKHHLKFNSKKSINLE